MIPNKIANDRGFTLLEVIIALAIIGIVIVMAFSFMIYGSKTLKSSKTHNDIQNDIRVAASYLSEEIKYATDLDIITLTDCESQIASHTNFNYFYIKEGALHQAKYINTTSYESKQFADSIINSGSYFQKDGSGSNILNFVLTASKDSKVFDVTTDIVLENFPLIDPTMIISGTGPEKAIRYKVMEPQLNIIQVTSIAINGGTTITSPNGTVDLNAVVSPSNASIKTVLWSSSDVNIASVNASGIVRALANGNVVITAKATDGSGVTSAGHSVTITGQAGGPSGPLVIGTTDPPNGTKDMPYGPYPFSATGGKSPYQFDITNGNLPTGLSLPSSGVLSGTPIKKDTYYFTITVVDAEGKTDSHQFSLQIKNN